MSDKRVLVLGATGYTGRLTVAELLRNKQPFAIAGRDRQRLDNLAAELGLKPDVPVLLGGPLQPSSLAGLFGPEIGVVINCVGPFTTLGEPVVKAAIAAGVHYLDITGEQAYLAHILDSYDDLARQKGCAIVPACGVEFALSNWAAALATENLEPIEDLLTATAAMGVRASRGTQLSLFEALAKPGLAWENGKRTLKLTASETVNVEFPVPFGQQRTVLAPLGEVVTIPRHTKVRNMSSYIALPSSLAVPLQIFAPILPTISKPLGKLLKPLARNPKAEYAESSSWAIVAESRSTKGKRRVTLAGSNVYELTAVITAWCAAKMLEADFEERGTLGPAQAFDPHAALAMLSKASVSCEIK